MHKTPDKSPIMHLEKHKKYDKMHNIGVTSKQTHQLHKWLTNDNIDNKLSNNF